jgi:hypothetical protein
MSGTHEMPTNVLEVLEGHLLCDPATAFVMMHVRGLILRLFSQLNIFQAIASMLLHNLYGFLSADNQPLCNTFGLLCRGMTSVLRREGVQASLPSHLIEDVRRLVCNLALAFVEREECLVEGLVFFILILSSLIPHQTSRLRCYISSRSAHVHLALSIRFQRGS